MIASCSGDLSKYNLTNQPIYRIMGNQGPFFTRRGIQPHEKHGDRMPESSSPRSTIAALLQTPVPLDMAAVVLLTSATWCSITSLLLSMFLVVSA